MPKGRIEPKTKLARLLIENQMSQLDLYKLIIYKTNKTIGMDMISNLVNGKKKNYNITTAKTICEALGVTLNDIVE